MSTLKQELEKTRQQYEVISNEKSVLIQKKRNISEKITFFKNENKKSRNLVSQSRTHLKHVNHYLSNSTLI